MALVGMAGLPFTSQKKEICALCEVSLSIARPHPGQKTGDCGYLITNAVAFQKITILVKHCPKRKALVQVFPYDLGKTWFEFCGYQFTLVFSKVFLYHLQIL